MLRVLREWVLARSAPASPLARACALHLLCRGFHEAGMMVLAGLRVLLGGAACGCVLRVLREWDLDRTAPTSSLARACALHLLCQDAG